MRSSHHCLTGMLLLALIFNTGCVSFDYKNLSASEQKKYYGTQPGDHKLSDYFSVDVSKGMMQFYFLRQSRVDKEMIGVIAAKWSDYANWGPREIAYAISDDGKRLLFFDEPGFDNGKPVNTKHGVVVADLYLFDAQSGQKMLIYRDVHRRGFACEDFPRNFVRFGKVSPGFNIEGFAYSTEGIEISLEARRKKLREAGRSAAICGPL